MTTADLCKLLGLAPDSPPGKIREAVADLPPGPVLDELACRAVSLEPERRRVDGIVDYSQERPGRLRCRRFPPEIVYTYSDPQAIYLPVSSDPAASHQLAMVSSYSLGWPFAIQSGSGEDWNRWIAWVQQEPPSLSEIAYEVEDDGIALDLFLDVATAKACGITPMHAALAVALAGLERSLS